jgi:hypothetical protein
MLLLPPSSTPNFVPEVRIAAGGLINSIGTYQLTIKEKFF